MGKPHVNTIQLMVREFINRHLIERFKHHFVGTKRAYPLWQKLHGLSLRGLNIGDSGSLSRNGELWIINSIGRVRPDGALIVFDVGANVGDYALLVLSRYPACQLFCFEPAQKAFERLTENLADFKNIKLHQFGLSDKEECLTLYSDVEASGMASVYNRRLDHINVSMNHTEQISLKTLDEFCVANRIDHIDFLKLDVEGHELSVLKGARRLISSAAIDLIQFEFGGTDIDSRTFLRDFFNILRPNYRICRILRDGVIPLSGYEESLEILVYSNFLAVSEKIYDSFIA